MLKSTPRKTPDRTKQFSSSKSSTSNHSLTNSLYFCHYRNAMYMGGIKSFQKHGYGIIIHDNGVSALTSYHHDLLHGHNVFFSNASLISAEYAKGKLIQVVYRCDGLLLSLHYNSEMQLDGKYILLNFISKTMIYGVYRKGVLQEKKQQKDYTIINKIFDLGNIDFLIGKKHSKVLAYEFERVNNIFGNKVGNKLSIGFMKNSLLNGLGFCFMIRGTSGGYNPDTHRNEDDFQLKLVERGYYVNSQLHGLGEKHFKNGNLYIGEFKNDIFEGNGILKNIIKKNWVSGYFEKGNLADLIDYSNQGTDQKSQKLLESLHERKTNWINNQIVLPTSDTFDKEIEKIMSSNGNVQIKTLEERKQEVLKKIQQNFINDQKQHILTNSPQKSDRKQNTQDKDVRKFIRSFIPEGEQIQNLKSYRQPSPQEDKKLERQEQISSSSRKSNIRKSRIFQRDNSKSADSIIKLYKIPLDQNQKSQKLKNSIFKPNTSRSKQSEALDNINSSRLESSPRGSIKPLDSKRIIGRSRIFKYLQNQPEQQPPKFTYKLVKDENLQIEPNKNKHYGEEYII